MNRCKAAPFAMRNDSTLYGSRQSANTANNNNGKNAASNVADGDRVTAQYLCNTCRSDMDIYVEMDDITIPAHRLIIGAGSAVLEAIVYGTGTLPGTEAEAERPTMTVKDCSAKHFHEVCLVVMRVAGSCCWFLLEFPFCRVQILRYLYTGKLDLSMESIVYIQMTAHFYELTKLEDDCLEFFQNNVQRQNVAQAFNDAHILNSLALKEKCITIMKNRIPCMVQIYSMELSAICEFFKKILFLNYKVIFEWLVIWAKKQPDYHSDGEQAVDNGQALRQLVDSRLQVVRFARMTIEQFTECLQMVGPEFFQPDEVGTIVQHIIYPTHTPRNSDVATALRLRQSP